MRIRVCQIIPTLVQGGAEKQMCLLANHLDPEHFESHVVVLTHSGPLEDSLNPDRVQLHFIEKRGKLDIGAYRRLRRTLQAIAPDIVQTWLFAANAYGRQAAKQCRVPTILASERCVDPWKQWWHFAIDRFLAKSTDAITTNTLAIVDFNKQHGLPAEKFTVIPNAVLPEPTNSQISKEEFFQRTGIPPRSKIVGAVGRLWKQKGYEDLIWAAELLRQVHEDVWFVIVGDGPDREKLQHFRDKVEAQHAVRFLGHRKDAKELMSAFDLLWNGSLYEGQSNTILEAMTRGLPVIASDIPGNRELVQNQQTGILYPLGDVETLSRESWSLLEDDTRLAAYGLAAKQRISAEFNLSRMIESYSNLYRELHSRNT